MKNYLIKRNDNGVDMFNDSFADLFRPVFYDDGVEAMKTDIVENDAGYLLKIDMPGFEKNEISLALDDGYVNVTAKKEEKEEDKKGRFIKRERSVSCSRSYYVGDVAEDAIKAKYDNGVLSVFVPKEVEQEKTCHSIAIE